MRIQTLHIDTYGRHKNLDLTFQDDGVQMILGPNEAGKTTLLEFIRELLFGFNDRNPYAFGSTSSSKIGGGASLMLDDKRVVDLHRRKGRKNTVTGSTSGEGDLDESTFERMLKGASNGLFRSVFAFGLEELVAGESSLAEQSVKSVLFSAGASSGTDPKKILDSLASEAGKLYTDRSQNLEINKRLKELAELGKQVKAQSLRCEAYEQRRSDLENAESQAAAIKASLLEADRELARRERLNKAFAPWQELRRLRSEREGLDAPADFPVDGLERLNAMEIRSSQLTEERDRDRENAVKAAGDLEDLRFDPLPIERRMAIESLVRSIAAIEQGRLALPEDRRKRDTALRNVTDRLASLVPGWTLEDLRNFRPTVEVQERLNLLIVERDARDKTRDTQEQNCRHIAEDLGDKQTELDDLGEPEDIAPWAAIVAEAEAYNSDVTECKRLRKEHLKFQGEVNSLLPRLSPPLLEPTIIAAQLPVPPNEEVGRFKQDFQHLERRIKAAEAALEKDQAEADTLDREILALVGRDGQIPGRDILQDMREDRDAGWVLIRRKFIDHQDVEIDIRAWLANQGTDSTDLVDAFPKAVARADGYADELFHHSSAVVKQETLHSRRERIRHGQTALDDLKTDHETLNSRWRSLWSACGFIPLPPEAMEGWLKHLEKLRSLKSQFAENEQEGRCARERTDAFESRLAAMLGRSARGPEMIAAARERERSIRETEKSRVDLCDALRRLREKADRNNRDAETIRSEEADWHTRRIALLRLLRLPETWDVNLLDRVLQGIKEATSELKTGDEASERITTRENHLTAFDSAVRALVAEIAPDLADAAPEGAAKDLGSRLTESVAARERRDALQKAFVEANAEADRRDTLLTGLAANRDDLLRSAGVDSVPAFRVIAAQAAAIATLDGDIQAKQRVFDSIRDNDPHDAFVAQLNNTDAITLKADRDEAETTRDRLQSEKSSADEEVGSRRQALSDYQKGSSNAAESQEKAASLRAQLAEDVDRYVPLIFAQHLLRQAIARFEQNARPEMLRETSRLFQTMTGGRYVQVDRPEDDEGPLQVRREDGDILVPSQLSTGTREQLYLAVRLAYALHYCDRAESLPIVMDDVLANFDDDRSRRTLQALGEVSRKVQVLFFTCHPHVIELGREVFPTLRPMALAPKAEAAAPTSVDAPAEASPKNTRTRRQRTLPDHSPPI